MKELFEQALLPYNLPLTVLMGIIAIYWLLSMIGTVDLDTFDVDLDPDVDVDGDVEASVDGDGHVGGNFIGSVLKFVNAQDVPIMIVVSLLTLFMWLISIAFNFYVNSAGSSLLATGFFFVNFIGSALLVKAVTQPLRPFLRALKNDKEHQEPLVGMVGKVKSRVLDTTFGQVEVARKNGAPALLNCRLATDAEPLVRGDEVLVIDHDEEKDRFIVRSNKSLPVSEGMDAPKLSSETTQESNNKTIE